jgi:hypothetical protein
MAKAQKVKSHLPAGFSPLTRSKLDGWFLLEEGNSVQGVLKEAFVMAKGRFGPKTVYKVEITKGMTKVIGEDGPTECAEGQTIGVDHKGWLGALKDVENGREVFIHCLGRDGEGERAAWKFEIGVSPL